jgi:hypothetical protein
MRGRGQEIEQCQAGPGIGLTVGIEQVVCAGVSLI